MTRYNTGYASDEKQWFTEQRFSALNRYDDKTKKNILRLEEKFGNIGFTPLDIPLIKDDNFFQWYFENAIPSVKQNKDVATEYTGGSSFLSIDQMPDWYDTSKSVWSKNKVDIEKRWPELWDQFYEYLPFDQIVGLTVWSSIKDIVAHRDQSLFLDLPLEFRIVMDQNTVDNFWVSEVLPNTSVEEKLSTSAIPLNLDTNSFVWSNLRTQHYSKFYSNHKKITFIFHWSNKINWKKYEKIIERSIEKYQKYALISSKKIVDFVDI